MRKPLAALGALVAVFAAAPAQDADGGARFWASREITFPVTLDKFQAMTPPPSKLRFYVAEDRGEFKRVTERKLEDLDKLGGERRGFRYASPRDGEYDFALQLVFPDGEAKPRDGALSTDYRVVFDTRPPSVRAAPLGTSGIEWSVTDENADPAGVRLEARWLGTADWKTVRPQELKLRDRYTWRNLSPSQPLEVRVWARDKAGHEMATPGITLPRDAAGEGLRGAGLFPPPGVKTGAGGLDGESLPSRPQIDYVNTKQLTIESKLTRVTRSGVRAAHLFVRDDKASGWRREPNETVVNITPETPDPTIRIPFTARADGLYGFIVIPENGAGKRQDDPRPNDPAQFLIEVDEEKPFVKVENVTVSPGGVGGERVDIQWKATDRNLLNDGINLEYSDQPAGGEWRKIEYKLTNTGRHVWQATDKTMWKLYIRASALDKAGNLGNHVYEKAVVLDLDKPQAVIDRVRGGGSAPAGAPDPDDVVPAPVPPQRTQPQPALPFGGGDGPPPVPKLELR